MLTTVYHNLDHIWSLPSGSTVDVTSDDYIGLLTKLVDNRVGFTVDYDGDGVSYIYVG